jgi:hypothetical protein
MFTYPVYSPGGGPALLENYSISYAAGYTINSTMPSGITAGDLLLNVISWNAGANSQITSIPAGWTRLADTQIAAECGYGIFYKIADGTETTTAFTNFSYCNMIGRVIRISGADPADPIGSIQIKQHFGAATTGNTMDGSSTERNNCLELAFYAAGNAGTTITWNTTADITTLDDASQGGSGGHKSKFGTTLIETASTAPTIGATLSGSTTNQAGFTIAINSASERSVYAGPVIASYTNTRNTATGATLVLQPPTGIAAGNLLVIQATAHSSAAGPNWPTTPAGWTKAGEAGDTGVDTWTAIFYKIADGTETTVSITAAYSPFYVLGTFMRITGNAPSGNFKTFSSSGSGAAAYRNIPLVYPTPAGVPNALGILVCSGIQSLSEPRYAVNGRFREITKEYTPHPGSFSDGAAFVVCEGHYPRSEHGGRVFSMNTGTAGYNLSTVAFFV